MKKFGLIRHAKADKRLIYPSDFERKLTERGQSDAHLLADYLRSKQIFFDFHWRSPATRCMETEAIFYETQKAQPPQQKSNEILYLPSAATLWQVIQSTEEKYAHPAIFAHNNGILDFVTDLSPNVHVPTCFIGFFESNAHLWSEVSPHNTQLIQFLYPKMLREQ